MTARRLHSPGLRLGAFRLPAPPERLAGNDLLTIRTRASLIPEPDDAQAHARRGCGGWLRVPGEFRAALVINVDLERPLGLDTGSPLRRLRGASRRSTRRTREPFRSHAGFDPLTTACASDRASPEPAPVLPASDRDQPPWPVQNVLQRSSARSSGNPGADPISHDTAQG